MWSLLAIICTMAIVISISSIITLVIFDKYYKHKITSSVTIRRIRAFISSGIAVPLVLGAGAIIIYLNKTD